MEKNKIKTSTGEKIFTVFNYAFFTLLCLIMLYPFWHEIMLSFSSLEASMKGGIFHDFLRRYDSELPAHPEYRPYG